jgi:lysozyme
MLNAVIDLSHHNTVSSFAQAAGSGVRAVIHKATQGHAWVDPAYAPHRDGATSAGLLWGAYHFAAGSDGVAQAEWFLSNLGDPQPSILVLDLEHNPTGPTMGLDEARAFVTHIQSVTGRWPGLYAGSYLKEILGTSGDPVLANCWFWLAQYGPTPVIPPNWATWTLWQYTDGMAGTAGPTTVPGIGPCDRDFFNGDDDAFGRFWS